MSASQPITLASGSAIRAAILRAHAVDFTIAKPGVDEAAIKADAAAAGRSLEETAMALADAKCMAVAGARNGFVIGSDQILEYRGALYDKPVDMAEAAARLAEMQGETHSLINATALAHDGVIVWRNVSRPRLTMRAMTRADIDAYLQRVGEAVLTSVGAYQVETAEGLALFATIRGDWFAVQGLAVYALLAELRRRGAFGAAWRDPAPVRAGVVGHPIGHSLSPIIHSEWARRAHIDGTYAAIDGGPDADAFASVIDGLRKEGYCGVNVTVPHKENALAYADDASDAARRIGAANMLTFKDGKTIADNSDAAGFQRALAMAMPAAGGEDRDSDAHSDPENNARRRGALVLGAGGAARGVVCALVDMGWTSIVIANRTREKAAALAAEFGVGVVDWSERSDAIARCALVVNATSLGMTGKPALEISLDRLRPGSVVFDIVYTPAQTPLLTAARARGAVAVNGLEMLMHQAAPGFGQWFGGRPYPVFARVDDELRASLYAALPQGDRA